jgi:hypothetical protein
MKPAFVKIPLFLLLLISLQYCTIDGFEQNTSSLTIEESLVAGQIIGESVSENQNGILSSFSEAFAIPGQTGLVSGPSLLSSGSFRNLLNYTYEFNPDSGIHQVTFTQENNTSFFNSVSDYTIRYKFFDTNQHIIENPLQRQDEIEAVDYSATCSGEIQANSKLSLFTRTDRLLMDGLSSDSGILTIDGFHSGEGTFTQIRPDGSQIEREYLLDINYLDIRINKELVQSNRNFRKGINGALSYESTVRKTGNGTPETKIVNGTIELNGDGTALLKFREQFDTFRLRLENGEVFDDDEFEGRITDVHLQEGIFTISNGQRIQINDQTEIDDDGDFHSLEEVSEAASAGKQVIAEGDYYQPDEDVNLWIATEVEFELESNGFEGLIASANPAQLSFTLINGDRFYLTETTTVQYDDGLESFEDVVEAVNTGLPVEAEGDFYIETETGNRIVKDVEFEIEFES